MKEKKDLSDVSNLFVLPKYSSNSTGGHVVPVADGVPVDPEMLVSCLFVSFSPKLGAWLSLDPRTVCSSRGAHILLQVVCF